MLLNPTLNQERITENLAYLLPDKFSLLNWNALLSVQFAWDHTILGINVNQQTCFPVLILKLVTSTILADPLQMRQT